MTHPLTDEIIEDLAQFNPDLLTGEQVIIRDHDMRAAADWQLDQVIHFLEANKDLSVETALRFIRPVMRPQQQEDN